MLVSIDATISAVLEKLADASIYAVLLVLGFVLFYFMHKNAIKEIKEFSDKAIEHIKESYKDAYKNLLEKN